MTRTRAIGICGGAVVTLCLIAFALFGRPPYASFAFLRYAVAIAQGAGAWALYVRSKRYLPVSLLLVVIGGIYLFGRFPRSQWVLFNWGAAACMLILVAVLLFRVRRTWTETLLPRSPQRYTENLDTYRARGGVLEPPTDIAKFAHNDRTRFFAFCLIADQIAKDHVPGDFAELGVFKGYSAEFLAAIGRRLKRKTYLLDTFEGFDDGDLGASESALKGAFHDTSLDAVRAKVGVEETVFIKGRFPASATEIPDNARFALVHIDCDLGEPMMAGLQFFYPRMQPGGFILMHDYSSLHWDGAEKAVDDFFAGKPESVIPLPDFCGSAVMRKNKQVR